MNKNLFILTLFLLMVFSTVNAQWENTSDFNIGISAKLITHNGYVFASGDQGGYFLYRSSDNGDTWENISPNTPEEFFDIYSFNGRLLATDIRTIYVSEDNGDSWNTIGTLDIEAGSGALGSFSENGEILYIGSNRRSYYSSTDGGNSWTEHVIDIDGVPRMLSFAAKGSLMLAIFTSNVAMFSDDGGVTWTEIDEGKALSRGYNFNGEFFSLTFGQGVSKYDESAGDWIQINSGLPDDGSLVIGKSFYGIGNTLFLSFQQLISNITGVYMSTDNGASWSEVDSEGLPGTITNSSDRPITANASYIFIWHYDLTDPSNTGVYRRAAAISSVEREDDAVTNEYTLSQNYPNPFNPSTEIKFSVPKSTDVRLSVYNAIGKRVAELVNQNLGAGSYNYTFNASNLSSGVYFYKLEAGSFSEIKKMMLIK